MQGARTQQDAAAPAAKKGGKKPNRPKKKRRSIIGYILRFIGCVFCLGIMACSVGGVLLSLYIVQVTADDEGTLDLDALRLAQTTIVYDRNGEDYTTFSSGDNDSIWRSLADMPKNLQNAVIAIEDKDFYNEPGINIKRTIAAALNEFTGGRLLGSRQGASTLEQQLIKNLTGDDSGDIMRKVREIFRAIGLATRYSKDTVLEAYLNRVPLTGVIRGMEAGASEYFNKHVEDLTLSECAVLASITKNPTSYNPFTNPEMLIARRNHVLYEMRTQGYITEEEYTAARAESITLVESRSAVENATRTSNQSYFSDALFEQMVADIMEVKGLTRAEAQSEIFSGGLRVYSTVDPKMQESMERLMLNENDELFAPLWHEEEVESSIPINTEITYDEGGLPLNPDGSSVFTTDDIPVYTDAEETILKTGTDSSGEYVLFYEEVRTQAAMTTLNYDGEIVAIAGGVGEKKYDRGTNRATIPHQTGSTMKPIGAYCLALYNKLITYSSPLSDSPYYSAADKRVLNTDRVRSLGLPNDPYSPLNLARDDVWRDWPTNYGGAGGKGDTMLIWDALRRSYNTIAVQVGSMVTAENIFNFVHDTLRAGYLDPETDVDLGPMVLGSQSYGMTTVELAGAFSIFNNGSYTEPHYYTEIYDYQGNIYIDNTRRIAKVQAIDQETAVIMNRMLQNVLYTSSGTASGMAPESEVGMVAAAKTGTTSDYRDYTFAGLTPYYVTAVWWGFDKPFGMYDLGGRNGKPTQLAWKNLMEEVQADLEYKEFFSVDTVVEKNFDPSTGNIISSGGQVGYYTEDNLPGNDYSNVNDDYANAAAAAAESAVTPPADTTTVPDAAANAASNAATTPSNDGGIQIG